MKLARPTSSDDTVHINAATPTSATHAAGKGMHRTLTAQTMRGMASGEIKDLEESRCEQDKALRSLSTFTVNHDSKFGTRARNRAALIWTLTGVVIYYLVSLGFYLAYYTALGYTRWDSTVIHSPQAAQRCVCSWQWLGLPACGAHHPPTHPCSPCAINARWLVVVLAPSTLAAFVFVRVYTIYYHGASGRVPAARGVVTKRC